MIQIDSKDIEQELERRRKERPITLYCPLSEIERCGYDQYAGSRCLGCRTVQDFFYALPEGIEDILREIYTMDIDFITDLVKDFLGKTIVAILCQKGQTQPRSLKELSEEEIEHLLVLQLLKDDLESKDSYYLRYYRT